MGKKNGKAGLAADPVAEFTAALEKFEYNDEVYKGEAEGEKGMKEGGLPSDVA